MAKRVLKEYKSPSTPFFSDNDSKGIRDEMALRFIGAARPALRLRPSLVRHSSTYDGFLSTRSAAREQSAIRALQPLLSVPGMISLGGGLPNPATFPFSGLQVTTKDGTTLDLTEALPSALQYSGTGGMDVLLEQLTGLQEAEHASSFDDGR